MDADAIQAQVSAYLRAVLRAFRDQHPSAAFGGLACECPPDAGAVYVYIRDALHDDAATPAVDWRWTYVEQEVEGIEDPTCFADYDALQTRYYGGESVDYDAIERLFATVLDATATAVAGLADGGELSALGFPERAPLSVFTEDDDDEGVGRRRVATRRAS